MKLGMKELNSNWSHVILTYVFLKYEITTWVILLSFTLVEVKDPWLQFRLSWILSLSESHFLEHISRYYNYQCLHQQPFTILTKKETDTSRKHLQRFQSYEKIMWWLILFWQHLMTRRFKEWLSMKPRPPKWNLLQTQRKQ